MKFEKSKKTVDTAIFTPAEISRLWEATDTNAYYSIILMLIYTGCRPAELLGLKKTEIDLPGRCFKILEAKTAAGIRTVPIAEKVVPFFEYWLNLNDCEYLLSTLDGRHFEGTFYRSKYWSPLMEALSMNHTQYDTRHTCRALLTAAGVRERTTNTILGVTNFHIAEMAEMQDAINKI